MAGLSPLTDRAAVLKAIAEYRTVGRDAFLERYGFGRAKWWYLHHEGSRTIRRPSLALPWGIKWGHL